MTAALGGKYLSYLPIGLFDGLSDLQLFTCSNPLPKPTLASFQAGGFTGQLNSTTNLGLNRLSSGGIFQLGQSHNSGNLMNNFGKLQQLPQTGNQHRNLLQGMPHSLELDSTVFPIRQQQLMAIGCSNSAGIGSTKLGNNVHNSLDDSVMLQGLRLTPFSGTLVNQAPNRVTHLNSDSFNVSTGVSSCPPEHNSSLHLLFH